MKVKHLILFTCICLISCTKEITIDTEGFEKKIVLNSLFTPGQPFELHFSYTYQPYESLPSFTDSVHLWLYENDRQVLDTLFLSDRLIK